MVRVNIISMLTKAAQAVLHTNMLIFEMVRVLLRLTLEILRVVRQCIGMNGLRVIRFIRCMGIPNATGPLAGRAGRGWSNMARCALSASSRPLSTDPVVDPTEVGAVAVKYHGGRRKPVRNHGAASGMMTQTTLPARPQGAQLDQPQEMARPGQASWTLDLAGDEQDQEGEQPSGRREGGRRTATSRRPLQRDAHPERPQETDTITVEARSNPLDLSTRGRMPQSAQQTARELFARRQPTRQSGPAKDPNCPGKEHQGRVAILRRAPTVMQCEVVPAQDLNSNHLLTVNQSRRPTTRTISSTRHQGPRMATLLILSIISTIQFSMIDSKTYDLEDREYDPELMYPINLTAFDCLKPDPKSWKGIDITRVQPCPSIDHDYLPVKNVTTSLVQSGLAVGTKVIRCDLKITQKIRQFDSSTHWGLTQGKTLSDSRRVYLTGKRCRLFAQTLEYVCDVNTCGGNRNSPPIRVVLDGDETQISYSAAGHYADKFSKSAHFYYTSRETNEVKEYEGVMEVIVKARVSTHNAFFDPRLDRIWSEELPFQAKWSMQGTAVDIDNYGTLAWEYREPQCEERLGVVASSTVTSIRRLKPQKRPGNGMQEYAGALAIMVNSTEQRASGVVISDERHLCLEHCFLTNVPQLLICIGGEDEIEKLDRIENRLLDSTTISRINAQTQSNLLQISSKLEIVSLSRMLHTKICDLDARATRQDFAQLLNGPSPYALQGLATGMDDYPSFGHNETAYTVSIRGSTAYFALCPPEQVQLVALPKCSLQVPVVRSDGTLAFVDPINRHLVDIPTWVECDSGLPVQFFIDDVYYCQSVNTIDICPARTLPTVLQPSVGRARGLKVDDLPALGLMTINYKQTQMISEIIREQEYGKIIQSKIVRATIESTDEITEGNGGLVGIRLGIPLSGIDIDLVANGVAARLYFMFKWFGDLYLNLIGIVFIISLTRQVIFFWLRVYQVTRIYGCGKWMLYAVFNSLWVTLAMPKLVLKAVYDKAEEEFSKQRVGDLPIPDNAQLARKHQDLCDAFASMQNTLSTIQVLNNSTVHPIGGQPVNRGNTKLNLALSRLEGKPYSRLEENGWVYNQDPRSPSQRSRDRPGNGAGDASSYFSTCTQEEEVHSPQSEVSSHPGSGQAGAPGARGAIQQPRGTSGGAISTTGSPDGAGLGMPPNLSSFAPDAGDHRAARHVDSDPPESQDLDPSQMRALKRDDSRGRDQ